MQTSYIGDALSTLHKFVDCCADWEVEGSCHGCRRLMSAECATCGEPLMTGAGDFYYDVIIHNEEGDELSRKFVHFDDDCYAAVVRDQMLQRVEEKAA